MTRAQDTTPATGLSGTLLFFDSGQEQTEAMVALQRDLSEICEEVTRAWLARVASEISLRSEIAAKLTTPRSVPDVLAMCAKSASQRLQMTVDDGRRLINVCSAITQKINRSLGNGWSVVSR